MATRSVLDYLRLLQSLLPKGHAWNRAEGSVLTNLLWGMAEEFVRIEEKAQDLLDERDTRYTTELITDHETDLGLPDICTPANATMAERRMWAHWKLTRRGLQDKQYFIDLAENFGFTITITEYAPFWCGVGDAGDPCGDQNNLFYWTVTVDYSSGFNKIYFLSGRGQCGDPLQYIVGRSLLDCILDLVKPAHTHLLYAETGPGFDKGFDSGFDSLTSSDDPDYLYGGFDRGFDTGFDVYYGGGFSDGFSGGFNKEG